jgi:hypothetical protein
MKGKRRSGERRMPWALAGPMLLLYLFLGGCEVLDPEERTPAFIKIGRPEVKTDPAVSGTDSHDIRYGWVFVDDQLEGVYELPAKVYTPRTGHRNIKIRAGIHRNGMSNDRAQYPFYDFYEVERELVPDSTTVLNPVFRYFDSQTNKISIWNEDFDDPNAQKVKARPSSDTTLELTQDPNETFEGNGAGKIPISSDNEYFFGASDADLQFEVGGEVYLEMNYKTSDTINVGILAEYPSETIKRSFLNLTTTRDETGSLFWNKIYVQLSALVGEEPNATSYEVFLQTDLRSGASQGTVLIDNFKVLYQNE